MIKYVSLTQSNIPPTVFYQYSKLKITTEKMTSKVILKYDLSFSLKYCKIASIIKVLKITRTLPKFLYYI